MKHLPHFLRLFDVQKYREIQPVIEGIVRRDAEAKDVIHLLKAAKEVSETNSFIVYNDPHQEDCYPEEIQERIDFIQKLGIAAWFDSLDRGEIYGTDVTYQIYSYICCPRYQRTVFLDVAISDMTVEYESLYYGCIFFDLSLPHMLSSEYLPVEILPQEMANEGTRVSIINRDQFSQLAEASQIDVHNLLPLNFESDTPLAKSREECLKIYNRLNYLVSVANSSTNYTLFMEEDLW